MQRWGISPAMLAACGAICLLAPAAAHADFTETLCSDGPAAPWTNGVDGAPGFTLGLDECSTGGGYQFVVGGNNTIQAGESMSAGIEMPAGEVLTAVNADYSTVASTGTGSLLLAADGNAYLLDAAMGSSQANGVLSAALPDASELSFRVYCTAPTSSAPPCAFPSNPLVVGAVTLTIHDTGSPTVAAAGGSLGVPGAYSGLQTLGYTAQDAGSGVAKVTASLGSTVVATEQSTCQSFELSPCPHTANGTFTIDTDALPNGSYPVTLTAYDMSGDATMAAVDTVTIRNTGTVSVAPRRGRRGRVDARVVTGWDWGHPPFTRVLSLRFVKLPAHASVTLSCRGRRCPRRRWPARRRVRRLARRLIGVRFHAGDRLLFTIRAPHRRPGRIRVTIRDGRSPTGRVLG